MYSELNRIQGVFELSGTLSSVSLPFQLMDRVLTLLMEVDYHCRDGQFQRDSRYIL